MKKILALLLAGTMALSMAACGGGSSSSSGSSGALFKTWGYDFHLTTKWFSQVFTRYKGLKDFKDSFVLSFISAPITALLSMIISYLVVKRSFKAKGFIEAVSRHCARSTRASRNLLMIWVWTASLYL